MALLATFVAFDVSLLAVIPSLGEHSSPFVGSAPCFLLASVHVPPWRWLVRVQYAQYKLQALGVFPCSSHVVFGHDAALQLVVLGCVGPI
jgi:hypothetical protein